MRMETDQPSHPEISMTTKENQACISIKPPVIDLKDSLSVESVHIIAVIDISGSMSSGATFQGVGGTQEDYGLSLLDLVKHAIRTIAAILQPDDHLSLITFSDTAQTIFEHLSLSKENHDRILKELDNVHPTGCTNLWDGLKTGLEMAGRYENESESSTILLLTDGLPNVNPPSGIENAMNRLKDRINPKCIVHTFGFGYQLKTKLLEDIAITFKGVFYFIPDASFVGTCFINALSQCACIFGKNCILSIETPHSIEANQVVGQGYQPTKTSWGLSIKLGNLCLGQSRDIVIQFDSNTSMPIDAYFEAIQLTYEDCVIGKSNKVEWNQTAELSHDRDVVAEEYFRSAAADFIEEALQTKVLSEGKAIIDNFSRTLETYLEANKDTKSEFLKDLLHDFQNEISSAMSKENWFERWGEKYLRSIKLAYLFQTCTNFKDVSLQHFGGEIFQRLREKGEDVFVTLPPPKPSRSRGYGGGGATRSFSMSVYHNSNNPCFAGWCMVKMADGSMKRVDQLRKGDQLFSPTSDRPGTIDCVLKTWCKGRRAQLMHFPQSGLTLTPYHPIRRNGTWTFPCDLLDGHLKWFACEAVFSFLLTSGHVMEVNGETCITFAHGNLTDPVLSHPYFATDAVKHDLMKFPEYAKTGLIEIREVEDPVVRDPVTHLISSVIQVK